MAWPRIGGAGIPLPSNATATPALFTNAVSLAAGETYILPPGSWMITTGPCSSVQYKDPIVGAWKLYPTGTASDITMIDSDGGNFRLANLSGTVAGALITSATTSGGGSYTNGIGTTATGVTVTPSAGSSKWVPVVGGAVSTTITSGTVGAGYNFPPVISISQPPAGGLQATAVCTLTSGNISVSGSNITVTNQGAGYTSAPTMTFTPDPREAAATTPGPTTTARVTLTLTGTGQLTGLYPSDNGTALTSVPTLSFNAGTAGTASATAIMNFAITGISASGGNAGISLTGGNAIVTTLNHLVATGVANAFTNPLHSTGVTFPRPARISCTVTSGAGITSAGATVEDPGIGIQVVPVLGTVGFNISASGGASANTPNGLTALVGGVTDTSIVQPF